ncbi:MAG: hypothetical protein O7D91_15075 [Planctomycetota bacterium]|nr:hypothetical protein [Planctomycetota bacterium]
MLITLITTKLDQPPIHAHAERRTLAFAVHTPGVTRRVSPELHEAETLDRYLQHATKKRQVKENFARAHQRCAQLRCA